jgi:hypothetical protein
MDEKNLRTPEIELGKKNKRLTNRAKLTPQAHKQPSHETLFIPTTTKPNCTTATDQLTPLPKTKR